MNKTSILIFVVFVFFGGALKAQEEFSLVLNVEAAPLVCSPRTAKALIRQVEKSFLEELVFVDHDGINTLKLESEVLSSNLLEGIDSYYFAKLSTTVTIESNINSLKKSIVVESEAKGNNACDAERKAMMKAVKGKNKVKILELLKAFNHENFETFCSSLADKANALIEAQKYQEVLSLLNAIPEEHACASNLIRIRNKSLLKVAEQNCQKELHELNLIVSAGEINQIKRNIYRLLRIPPNAPCKDEAIELAEKIGALMKEQNKSSKELNTFHLYINENDETAWRNRYIRSSKL